MILNIKTKEQLKDFCAQLEKQPFIAVDTEFLREKTYRSVLCLVQVAAPDESLSACIDPLATNMDLSPLLKIMNDPKILKVFHSARQDLEIFYDLMGCVPAPLFDTQVGAMVCGLGDCVSYQSVVNHYLGIDLDKSSRVTDWSFRPLSEKQLSYALADVTYLVKVYEKMTAELSEKKRQGWVIDEMQALCDPALYEVRPMDAWQRLKPASTSSDYLAVLQAISAWREQQAADLNKPRRHIMRDEMVLDLAALAPTSVEDFARLRSKGAISGNSPLAQEIIAIVKRALMLPEDMRPHFEREKSLTPDQHTIKEMLRLLLSVISTDIGVAPRIIASGEDLEHMARDDNADIPAMKGWRFEVFGQKAEAFKAGRLMMFFNPKTKRIAFQER